MKYSHNKASVQQENHFNRGNWELTVEEKKFFTGLFCMCCLIEFEDGKGNFKCPKCKFEVSVLR